MTTHRLIAYPHELDALARGELAEIEREVEPQLNPRAPRPVEAGRNWIWMAGDDGHIKSRPCPWQPGDRIAVLEGHPLDYDSMEAAQLTQYALEVVSVRSRLALNHWYWAVEVRDV